MLYFLDTEFIETGKTIHLISIGIVDEYDREYYAINADCDFSEASDWVKENVITQLPPKNPMPTEVSPRLWEESKAWKKKEEIMCEVALFLGCGDPDISFVIRSGLPGYWDRFVAAVLPVFAKKKYSFSLIPGIEQPEVWGEWPSYDHVVFCWLFGTMMDLPKGFPMRCRDIIQYAKDHLSISSDQLPASLETEGNHHALLGAKTVKQRYLWLKERS